MSYCRSSVCRYRSWKLHKTITMSKNHACRPMLRPVHSSYMLYTSHSPSFVSRRKRRTRGIRSLTVSLEPTEQPIRQPDDLRAHSPFPLPPLLDMLNRMTQYPPLLVKLEYEQPGKLPPLPRPLPSPDLLPPPARHRPVLFYHRRPVGRLPLRKQQPGQAAAAAPDRPPAHDQLVLDGARAAGPLAHHALREDLEAHVAETGDAVPGDGGGPEGGLVGDAAADGGEVGVRRGEEVEGYGGREDVLREGGVEEGREAGLQDSEGWEEVC